jgi:hypothetical protein
LRMILSTRLAKMDKIGHGGRCQKFQVSTDCPSVNWFVF